MQKAVDYHRILNGKEPSAYTYAPPAVHVGPETQASVSEWGREIFGVTTPKRRAIAVLEEASELGLELGLTPEEIHAVVEVPIQKASKIEDCRKIDNYAEEAADVLLCLYVLADRMGFHLHEELDKKMARNRSRTPEYYAGKRAAKLALGLPTGE
jgi:NTP pyrophosphatase (non-canonical NTP hydrolase)